jgi:hypothetical protein
MPGVSYKKSFRHTGPWPAIATEARTRGKRTTADHHPRALFGVTETDLAPARKSMARAPMTEAAKTRVVTVPPNALSSTGQPTPKEARLTKHSIVIGTHKPRKRRSVVSRAPFSDALRIEEVFINAKLMASIRADTIRISMLRYPDSPGATGQRMAMTTVVIAITIEALNQGEKLR